VLRPWRALPAAEGSASVTSRWSVELPLLSAARLGSVDVLPACVAARMLVVVPLQV
jgi:hypothetical protein